MSMIGKCRFIARRARCSAEQWARQCPTVLMPRHRTLRAVSNGIATLGVVRDARMRWA